MKKIISFSILLFFIISITIPAHSIDSESNFAQNKIEKLDTPIYSSNPDWESGNPGYSTGGALTDINQDGLLDLVVADGNDIDPGYLHVYLNDGNGGYPIISDWHSQDTAYNGHLDIADVNGDGWPDIAVSHLGTGSTFAPIARVYLNNNGVLSSTADWEANINGNAFGVAFGDINNDGRPDLAVATGWSYSPQHHYHNVVYFNNNGVLEPTPGWSSSDMNHYHGALWLDADYDGWLDLAYIGQGIQTQIYRNLGGSLTTTAYWQTSDSGSQDGLMIATGDVTQDGYLDLFTTDNTQLGGTGEFKQYTGLSGGFFQTTKSWTYYEGYGSAIALADVNLDGKLDLATGGWWDHTRLFLNTGSELPTQPDWSSGVTSVVEKIVFGNVGPIDNEFSTNVTFTATGSTHIFYLPQTNIQYISEVIIDGISQTPEKYTYNREYGWISVKNAPSNSIKINYTYSKSLDMIVTNWDGTVGNFLYYNQLGIPDLEAYGSIEWYDVQPNQTIYDSFLIENIGDSASELDWEIVEVPDWGDWTFAPGSGTGLKPEDGAVNITVEVIVPASGGPIFEGEIRVENQHDASDFCMIPVHIEVSTEPGPVFEIESVEGPLGIQVTFKNTGDGAATDVFWEISVKGGLFGRINKSTIDNIRVVAADESISVLSGIIFGFGTFTADFYVTCDEGASKQKTFDGIQLLFFTLLH